MVTNLMFVAVHQLAQIISNRQLSVVEVLEAHLTQHLTQIAQHNSKLNSNLYA